MAVRTPATWGNQARVLAPLETIDISVAYGAAVPENGFVSESEPFPSIARNDWEGCGMSAERKSRKGT